MRIMTREWRLGGAGQASSWPCVSATVDMSGRELVYAVRRRRYP